MLRQHDALGVTLGLIGAGMLLSLACEAARSAFSQPSDRDDSAPTHHGNSLRVGLICSLANPAGIVFWSGFGASMSFGTDTLTISNGGMLLVAYAVGAMCWGCGMVALIALGRRYASERVVRWVNLLTGAALSYVGIRLLLATAQRAYRWLNPALRGFI